MTGESDEAAVFEKLARVSTYRRRFSPEFRRIVDTHLAHVAAKGTVLEVGSGDGYLGRCLPSSFAKRMIYTEPTPLGVAKLRKQWPDAEVRQASAHRLPIEDGAVAAIVACCVFDLIPDLSQAWDEWSRVLTGGGVVVHFLDLATDLHALFTEIVEDSDLYAIPNVFTDPTRTRWPEDLLLVPRRQLDLVITVLESCDPASATSLAAYRDAFRCSPEAAVQAFSAIHESNQARRSLHQLFRKAMKEARGDERQTLASFEGRPVSSAHLFQQRLAASVPPNFEVVKDALVLESTTRPRKPNDASSAWRSIVGFIQSGDFAASHAPSGSMQYTELAAHVFVARKSGS